MTNTDIPISKAVKHVKLTNREETVKKSGSKKYGEC